MSVRLVEGQLPYSGGTGIEITANKVINLLLRQEDNLINVNDNNEVYVDLQLDNGIKPTDDFPVGITTGNVNAVDGWIKSGLLLHYETTDGKYVQWLATNDKELYVDRGDGEFAKIYYAQEIDELLEEFMRYSDFYFVEKSGTTIELGFSVTTTPTSNFIVEPPAEVKDGQIYILRVNNGATAYRMSLDSRMYNPNHVDLTLTPNAIDMFVFLAVGQNLELQPNGGTNLDNYQLISNMKTTLADANDNTYPTTKAVADAITQSGGGDMMKSTYDPNNIQADAFNMDNMSDGTAKHYVTTTQINKINNISGINTGDETTSSIKTKLGVASTTQDGYLTKEDYATFNNKSSFSGNYNDLTNKPTLLSQFTNDLTAYYLKSETYTQAEVNSLISSINQFHYEIYTSTSQITTPATNVLYLIGPSGTGLDKYEEYVYANNQLTKIGDTSVDLSQYMQKPTGGTAGQVLTKTDDGYEWGDVDGLPAQTGNEGKFLTTDGTSASWNSPVQVMTQDEYDALPTSKDTDGIVRFIYTEE